METKKINRFIRIYPWFSGLSADLLFWIAIDTLFLQLVKGFSLPEIVTITTVSEVVGIAFQLPIMKIAEKLGNTKSIKLGAFLTLLSALSLTFGNGFVFMALGKTLREVAFSFKTMGAIALEHNLSTQNREGEFIKYSTKANSIYAVATMLISVVASPMFNLYHYLPMFCCIAICIVCFVLSLYMVDYTETDGIKVKEKKQKQKLSFNPIVIFALISFGAFFSIVATGQENAKLFIQDNMLKEFTEDNTALILGLVVFVSRVVRVVANILFYKIYNRIKDKVGVLFSFVLFLSFIFLILGTFIKGLPILKYSIMSIGYIIILFARDPFKVYINHLVLSFTTHKEHRRVMMLLEFARKLMAAIISVTFAAILTAKPMLFIIILYAIYAVLEIGISCYLYIKIKKYRMVKN